MGRRSINTTKSGKYMNPTDQARKEARKRELKKNKKQRQMVRAAVLKGKDPLQIISDMEKIDEMEYSVVSPPLLNEKVLKDKRKKLKETWDRVMRLYSKEDRDRYLELKKLEIEYESRRATLMKYFESVRVAQQVQIDEIPLPAAPDIPMFLTSQIPLPNELEMPLTEHLQVPPSILKKSSSYFHRDGYTGVLRPPGVPPGPPPELSSDDDDGDEEVDAHDEEMPVEEEADDTQNHDSKYKTRKIRFADENALETKMATEDEVGTMGAEDGIPQATSEEVYETIAPSEASMGDTSKNLKPEDIPVPPIHQVPLPAGPPPRLPQGPPPIMFRPPPLRPGIPPPPRILPPGVPPPPPGRPSFPPPGLPLRLGAPPIRLPPGPPPGIPPLRLIRPPPTVPPPRLPPGITSTPPVSQQLESSTATTTTATTPAVPSAVLSAPPSLMQRPKSAIHTEETKRTATIEAKPQIRNLSADVMRFTPTTLRVKREDRHKRGGAKGGSAYEPSKETYPTAAPVSNPSASAPTKDDAYEQFLREMEELL